MEQIYGVKSRVAMQRNTTFVKRLRQIHRLTQACIGYIRVDLE